MTKLSVDNKLLRTLAIMASLFYGEIIIGETEIRPDHTTTAAMVVDSRGEAHNEDYAEADMLLTPKASTQIGEAKVDYSGTFRKVTNTDGETGDLQTITHKVNVDSDELKLKLGRDNLRKFGDTTTTVGFDNFLCGKGFNRNFTGAFLEHKPSELTLGAVSKDTEMSPGHWDMLLANWNHRFETGVGTQLHLVVTREMLERAGIAVEYRPSDKTILLLDTVYKRPETSVLLAGNFKASEDTKFFAAAELTDSHNARATGKIIAGVEKNLGHGLKATGAIEQDVLSENTTTAIIGLKFNGSMDLL